MPAEAEPPARSPRPHLRPAQQAIGTPATPGAPDAAGLVAAARLGGTLGYVVAEAATGRVLEGLNGDLGQPPASVAKTITSLYALEHLGVGHRFATRLVATGPVVDGRIAGDLVLVGSGDPTLATDTLGDMAAALAARGVRGVTGRYLAYAGALPLIGQIDGEQPPYVGYNPAISGLNLNFNRVNFEWKRRANGYDLTMDARGERFVPKVRMARVEVVNRDTPLFTYAAEPQRDGWTVAAAALGKGGGRWLPVRQPAVYAAEVFQTLAAAQGITLPDAGFVASPPAGTVLVEHLSDDLTVVLRDMLKFSTNLTAEVLGLTCSGAANLAESGRRMSDWAANRFGLGARLVDHSGLGSGSRISAGDLVKALLAGRATALPGLLRELEIRDAARRVTGGQPLRVQAKTGTLNFVSGLAGYVEPPGGRDLVFAVFCADAARRDQIPMSQREQPPGAHEWVRRARNLQHQLVGRWAMLYG